MPRDNIKPSAMKKLQQFFTKTLDTNNDGLVNWTDFEAAIEVSGNDSRRFPPPVGRFVLVDRLERRSGEKCPIESFAQAFGTTLSKILLGFVRRW